MSKKTSLKPKLARSRKKSAPVGKISSGPRFDQVTKFNWTDSGNASLFAALFSPKLRYDHGGRRWLIWRDHWWEQDKDSSVMEYAKAVARWRARAADVIQDDREYKWAIRSEGVHRLEAMLKLATSIKPLADSGGDWDSNPLLLGVANGVVDLTTGRLRPGKPSDKITLHTDIAFDAQAQCPRFEKFVHEIFGGNQELINFVHKAIGYSLTGNTTEQVFFLCYGSGANGKSTFLDTVRTILGGYAYNLPFSAFELKGRSAIPNEIAALSGKRFVTAIETNESVQLNEARIKALTGSDPITGRFLYKEFFTFNPTGKFWLAFNHRPTVTDDSQGFWRRVRLIPFLEHFPEDRRDPNLTRKLKAEAPGILNWAVRGASLWLKEGLEAPPIVKQESENYRADSDALGEFLEDRCVKDNSASVTAKELWAAYQSWTLENGDRPMDRRAFSERLKARGYKRERFGHSRNHMWFGIGLKSQRFDFEPSGVRADADVKIPLLN